MELKEYFEKLKNLEEESKKAGGEERIKKQHNQGKLTARERIELLLDPGTFQEVDRFATHTCTDFDMDKKKILGDGIITGFGTVNKRLVYVFAQDFTVFGGTMSERNAQKVCKIMDLGMKNGAPVIGLNDSGGARIQEGVSSLAGYADVFLRNTLASGVIPQISAIMGPCAGGAVYSPAITDFIIMVKGTSYMFVTGPEVIKTVTHEEVTMEKLGGAETHATISGVAHFVAENDAEALSIIRALLSYIPQNNKEIPPKKNFKEEKIEELEELNSIIPANPLEPYDIKDLIIKVLDENIFLEVHKEYAKNIVIGFGNLAGYSVGIVANQPAHLAGCLDINASDKGARFVRFCDCFNIPIIIFEDVPGFLPGKDQEWGGIIRHGAKLLYAIAEATVPKITVITRKAYGGAYCVMGSKHIRTDVNFAYPTAEIAVMGPEGAVNILYKEEIEKSQNPDEKRKELVENYVKRFANPYITARKGYIDEVIMPSQTRKKLISALRSCINKRDKNPERKHGNIPL